MRVLAVDFGSKRIGFAAGDTAYGIASPVPAIDSIQGLEPSAEAILKASQAQEAEAVVLGIPLGPEGEETPMSKVCRRLAQTLREQGFEVFEVDESLSSIAAEERLRVHDLTAAQRDRHKDSEAACLILERFFAEHGQEEA